LTEEVRRHAEGMRAEAEMLRTEAEAKRQAVKEQREILKRCAGRWRQRLAVLAGPTASERSVSHIHQPVSIQRQVRRGGRTSRTSSRVFHSGIGGS
jgi:hypothetical protein